MPTIFVNPGRFRDEVRIEEAQVTPDGGGGYTEAWVERAVVFAHVEPVAATAFEAAGQSLEQITHRVTMRHRDGIAAGMRLLFRGRVLTIATVRDPDETRRYLVCRAREELQ